MQNEAIILFLEENYGLDVNNIRRFESGVLNDNYLVATGKNKYIFRVYNFKNEEQVKFEAEILEFLQRKGFPSPKLLANRENKIISVFNDKPCVVYEFIEGRPIETVSSELMGQIGEAMAKMHNLLKDFKPSVKKSTWEPEELRKLVAESKNEMLNSGFPRVKELMDFVETELAKYNFSDELPKGITHQDIKPENIIIKDGKIAGIVDFDNSYFGAFLHDITTTIIWTCFENNELNKNLLDALLDGYEKERKLTALEKEYLSNGIKFRLVREVFIGPFVTMHLPELSRKRADYFIELYKRME
jgi:Ser/Thr protein kinase RdoA (MazF antagonist)